MMAKEVLTMYPIIALGGDGRFVGTQLHNFRMGDEPDGRISENGWIYLNLPAMQITVEYPDDYSPQALAVLRASRTKLTAAHQLMLTQLQFLENSFLGLAAPDIIDAPKPSTPSPTPAPFVPDPDQQAAADAAYQAEMDKLNAERDSP